jgi:hypothetical protein
MLTVLGLDGKTYKMDINTSSFPMRNNLACKSKLQFECGKVLKSYYGMSPILEEVSVPGHRFFLDFFLPTQKIVYEIHGIQHDKYVPFFHKSKANFMQSKIRDNDKKYWCEINDISFYEVRSVEELEIQLGLKDAPTESGNNQART